jgi:phosphate transport system permease protein
VPPVHGLGRPPGFETFGWGFLTRQEWDVPASQFGALVPVFGTWSPRHRDADRGAGELRHRRLPHRGRPTWMRTGTAAAIELLAGIPSIIYGMWGLFVLAPFLGDTRYPVGATSTWASGRCVGKLFAGRRSASAC